MMSTYSALVLGGSGGVGRSIVKALAYSPEFSKVTLILRKPLQLPETDANLNFDKFDQKLIDFDKISESAEIFKGSYDIVFYAIGVSQTAVDKDTYRKIEYDNAIEIANLIKEADIKDVHWVTGRGVKKDGMFLFARTKAEVEEKLSSMGFRRLAFYRPAAVLTPEKTGAEGLFLKVWGALDPCHWNSVETQVLGNAIVANSLKNTKQQAGDGDDAKLRVEILENKEINTMGKNFKK